MLSSPKHLPRQKLAELLDVHRQEGQRIVLCNGVFDLIHVGHIRVLQAAKEIGDLLVVAVNSDKSANFHKGDGRPIQKADDRCEILSALSCVDYTFTFDETSVAESLRMIQPTFHAKGEDYDISQIPEDERQAAEEYSIELRLLGGKKISSSSQLIAATQKLEGNS